MSAIISNCGTFRYRLDREIIAGNNKAVAWIMVNPSTADATLNDQTIKKVIGFSERNGFGRAIVGNIFAYRATDVRELESTNDPVGPDNDTHLQRIIDESDKIIVAWGSIDKVPAIWRFRWSVVYDMIINSGGRLPFCLGSCKNGHPKHPQMLGYNTPLTIWSRP